MPRRPQPLACICRHAVLLAPVALLWLAAAGPAAAQLLPASCPQITDDLEPPSFVLDNKVVLTADRVLLEKEGLSSLAGAVKLRHEGREFSAESLDYDDTSRTVTVRAESVFRNDDLLIRSREATFDLAGESGSFRDTEFTLASRSARGSSSLITLAADRTAALEDARYTTCAPGSRAWYLEAGNIKLDYDEGLGSARNARLRFMGVPILYAPWFQFPIDDRRRTGVLFPTVGESGNTGFDVRVPIYLNLGPNYDATVTPRYMSSRGIQLGSEGRYLLRQGFGSAGYEFLSDDEQTGSRRTYAHYEHTGLLNRRMEVDLRYAETSDQAYFEDLGGRIDVSSITHLDRSARLTYEAPAAYTIFAMAQSYQTIASNLTLAEEPYRRLPYVRIDALSRNSFADTRVGVVGEYGNFLREASVEGQRIGVRPFLRMERDNLAWYLNSQLDFSYTNYQLRDATPAQGKDLERGLPLFSAEGGLRFERFTGGAELQTLEPRLLYLYVPFEDQDALPVFDSGEPDFDFTQLFARNRFSGEDRISDANHFAAALTSRQLDPLSGRARYSASVGQLFRFEAPTVQLPGATGPDSGATDFIASLDYHLSKRLTAGFAAQWSPDEKSFNRTALNLRYRTDRRRLDLSYRYRQSLLEQADVTASTPVGGGWRLAGRWRYSLLENQSLDTLAGVEYETCCWALRTSYRRYIANTNGDYDSGVYLQLELKGLARIGSGFPGLQPAEAEAY